MDTLFDFGTLLAWCTMLVVLARFTYIKTAPLRHQVVNRAATRQAIEMLDTDRAIREQDHELWPNQKFDHVNCTICGPGPLLQGLVPSKHEHPFFSTKKEWVSDGYGSWQVERLKGTLPEYATTVSSTVLEDGRPTGKHTLMLDLDFPVTLMESTTTGHHHLYADRLMSWPQYKGVLRAMKNAGLIEKDYYKAACRQQATMLRPPWVKKPRTRPSPPPNLSPRDRRFWPKRNA